MRETTVDRMIEKEDIESIIPHRGKMLLLSRVSGYNLEKGTICAEYDISADCVFYDPALCGVPSWAGFEFMAQAISAFSGIRNRELGIKPRMGFILSIPQMRALLPVYNQGCRVQVCVEQKDRTELIYTFEGKTLVEGKTALEGKLMVMELDKEKFDNLTMERN